MIISVSESIINNVKSRFKIKYSLGYVLCNIESNVLRYYPASSNNSMILETARLISNRQNLIDFLSNIAEENFQDMLSCADTKGVNEKITNIVF